MIWGIILIILSIISVPSLILSKNPDAKILLEKVDPYQGWIGISFLVFGVWNIIRLILKIESLTTPQIWWITLLIGNLTLVILGFMLGYGQINKLLYSKNKLAKETTSLLREKLAPKIGMTGIVGIGIGIWMIIASFVYDVL